MQTRRCGERGPELSVLTLGLMVRDCRPGPAFESVRQTILRAVERGITSIDLATGYGGGAVEQAFGRVLRDDLRSHRDQLVIATKAGWADGTRKTLAAAMERSLEQIGVDTVDIFYHHAPDASTPVAETAGVLDELVRQGKTRFVGVSNYSPEETARIVAEFDKLGTPCVVHQPNYNMLNRWVEDGLLDTLRRAGMGSVVFSPVSQGLLSDASATGPRPGSRAEGTLRAIVSGVATGERAYGVYPAGDVQAHVFDMLRRLQAIARRRGQTLAQLALTWALRDPRVSSALVGMSSVEQVEENVAATRRLELSSEEATEIEAILPPRPPRG